ncbi:MAG TPA: hypothetical protein VK165_07975 [Azonexus sp.]|nr:hypothetical protein [Azonexus sp.]
MRISDAEKKGLHSPYNPTLLHKITTPEQEEAIDLIRWVYAVARLPADSPRFNWYVSRWLVPEKIARAKAAGTFETSISNCLPIDPAWIRLVPAALEAYREFITMYPGAGPSKPASSNKNGKPRNTRKLAA